MKHPDKRRWCVFLVICLLGIAYVGITLARIEAHISDAVTDSVKLGLIVILCLTGYLSGRDYFRFTRTAPVFLIAMSFLILYHLIELTEEFVIFQSVPIFGEGSLLKRAVETILMIGSVCLFLGGNYLSVRDINQARQQMESHVRDLSESREQYRCLMTHNVAGIWRNELRHPMPLDLPIEAQVDWLMDQDILVEANDVIVKMYGFDRAEDVLGKTNREIFTHDEQDVRRALRAWIEEGFRFDGHEIRHHITTGEYRWFLMMGHGIIEDRHLIGSWGTALDITERKLAEEALQASEEKNRSLIQNIPDVVWTTDEEGHSTYISSNVERVYGFTAQEICERGAELWLGRIHSDDGERVQTSFDAVFKEGVQLDIEYRIRRKDGEWIWLQDRSIGAYEKDGIKYADGVFYDITERKKAEEAQKMSEQRLVLAHEAAGMGMFDWDLAQDKAACNDHYFGLFGLEPRAHMLSQEDWLAMVYPDDRARAQEEVAHTLTGKAPYDTEYRVVWPDKSVKWISSKAKVFYDDDGMACRMIGAMTDVTEQKETRLALEAEQRFTEKAINAQVDTFFVFNPDTGKPVTWTKSFSQISGYSDKEIMTMKAPDAWYSQEDLNKTAAAIGQMGEKGYSTVELSLRTKSRGVIPFEYRSSMIEGEGGETLIIAVGRDITERTQAEEILRESEQRARALLNATTDSVLFLDKKGGIIDLNEEMARRLGRSRDAMIGTVIYDYLSPDLATQREAHANRAECTRKPVCFEDQRAGRWLENNIYPVIDAQGEVVRFAVYSRDITERKQAEEALHRERRLNEELFKTTPAFAVAINAEGRTVMMNDAMCRALGYASDEVIGVDYLATFIPERERAQLAGVFEALNSSRDSSVSENLLLTRDGRELLVEWRGSQIFKKNGEFEFLFGLGIDITERRQTQQKLADYQKRLRSLASELSLSEEHERRKMAGHLHDGPCQELAVCLLKLETLRSSHEIVNKTPVAEVCQMIHQTVQDLRDLTFALSPPTLYLVGLEAAIEELLKEKLRNEHGILYDFKRANISPLLGDDLRALLFQSVRELLNNIVKYANPKKVTVTTCREDRSVKVIVEDDGIGFDVDTIGSTVSKTGGYGLFNMGERIAYVGGQLDIWSQPGQGSRFIITVPLEIQGALV